MAYAYDLHSYLADVKNFLDVSATICDGWHWHCEFVKQLENSYLRKYSYISGKDGILKLEHLVHYSISYNVPILSFRIWNQTGTPLKWEDIRKLPAFSMLTQENQMSTITQQEHPIIFQPYYMVHPCHTAEILGCLKNSHNKLVTYLSTYGPIAGLNLNLEYASLINKSKNN